ncbi:MAG: sigma 54-interacting transcriptional regulator, partial [Burkholderiaceae bacterium]
MSENDNQACNALWLDPYQPAGETERERLAAAGLSLLPVRTLEDLRHALKTAKTVVVRLMDSTELLTEVRRLVEAFKKDIPVICRSTPGQMGLAVEAMREGACHVIPADDYSEQAWRAALAHVSAAEKVTPSYAEPTIATVPGPGADKPRAQAKAEQPKTFVFVDPMSQKLLALAQRVAQASVTTLITGPTGAGKEVLATVIHESSSRANGPFVSLNCGAIPENLMEDMLFGHDRGAYTGAHRDHKGIFEQAQGGTVFLDEIGELPANLQTKLLRVLQERKLTRLGGQQTIDLDFRLIAATNKDLKQAMLAREFREDLYFRISTFRLAIPALRQRPEDILPLANQMLRRHAEPGLATPTLPPESQRILLA